MRTIKFRVWDLVEQRMLMPDNYGEMFAESTGIRVVRMLEGDQNYRCNNISACDEEGKLHLRAKGIEPSDDFVIMQFTGLLDYHGKEIYEGDIVVGYQDGKIVGDPDVIEYWYCGFRLKNTPVEFITFYVFPVYQLEVIGNIHENTELINEKQTANGKG